MRLIPVRFRAPVHSVRLPRVAVVFWTALLVGCSALPERQTSRATDGQSVVLLPMDQILAAAGDQTADRAGDQAGDLAGGAGPAVALAARAARLRARAALMRGPVLAPDTRARLEDAIRAGQA